MVIFHSYISLPEGKSWDVMREFQSSPWLFHYQVMVIHDLDGCWVLSCLDMLRKPPSGLPGFHCSWKHKSPRAPQERWELFIMRVQFQKWKIRKKSTNIWKKQAVVIDLGVEPPVLRKHLSWGMATTQSWTAGGNAVAPCGYRVPSNSIKHIRKLESRERER